MTKDTIITAFQRESDEDKAIQMKRYMRNQFEFLGIQTPLRNAITKKLLADVDRTNTIDWALVKSCWSTPYREIHYFTIDYILKLKSQLKPTDLLQLKELITKNSWWDTIDRIREIMGILLVQYPEVKVTLIEWSTDTNFWVRRAAIICQLLLKKSTDKELLEVTILNNLHSDEFFINKAIGWALRDYAKCNPTWVINFIDKNRDGLSKLTIREATKHL